MADPEVVADYRRKLMQQKELASSLRNLREDVKTARKDLDKTEDDLKALQSVGPIIGEVLRQLDSERLIVKASSGPRYVVRCRNNVDKEKLVAGTPVALDMTAGTLTIMRALPRETNVSSTEMDQPLSRDNKPNQGADFVERDEEAFKQASRTRRPRWTAPEAIIKLYDGEEPPGDLLKKSEVYTFGITCYGITCYEVVTGKYPFDGIAGENLLEKFRAGQRRRRTRR